MPAWLIAALPWIVVPAVLLWRGRGSVSLGAYAARTAGRVRPEAARGERDASADPHLVSVILPARDEAHNIEPCLRSILASEWRDIEVFVVDDHSTDGTGAIARRVAAEDPRVIVLDAPALPDGWFGKQWACHTAVQRARGATLLFTDADTRHTPELLPRALGALDARGADLLSVVGAQEFGGFWERLLQPQVFTLILMRYGNTETMSRSTRPVNKIANGQFFIVRREAYDRAGGHARVRDHVAEDLRLAQEVCRAGGVVHFLEGRDYLSTRMYEGLGALWRGWRKNVYAGGRDAMTAGPVMRRVLRVLYPLPALWNVAPALLGAIAALGLLPPSVLWWALVSYAAALVFWVVAVREFGATWWYALLYPVGAACMAALFAEAAWRGDRVEWKGREYRSVAAS